MLLVTRLWRSLLTLPRTERFQAEPSIAAGVQLHRGVSGTSLLSLTGGLCVRQQHPVLQRRARQIKNYIFFLTLRDIITLASM